MLRADRRAHVLGIHHKQPDLALGQALKVNHPHAAAFASPGDCPANLPASAGALDDIARIGIECQPSAKLTKFLGRPLIRPQGREDLCLGDGQHLSIIRHCGMYGNDVPRRESSSIVKVDGQAPSGSRTPSIAVARSPAAHKRINESEELARLSRIPCLAEILRICAAHEEIRRAVNRSTAIHGPGRQRRTDRAESEGSLRRCWSVNSDGVLTPPVAASRSVGPVEAQT
jgi:hypothetical protein